MILTEKDQMIFETYLGKKENEGKTPFIFFTMSLVKGTESKILEEMGGKNLWEKP